MRAVYQFIRKASCTCYPWQRLPIPLVLRPVVPWAIPPVLQLDRFCDACLARFRAAPYVIPEKHPDVGERERLVNADPRAMLEAGTPVKSDLTED